MGESSLVPTRLVNFSGCNFRCSFCLTGRDSQDAKQGKPLNLNDLAASISVDAPYVKTLTIEGGEASIFLPDALRIAAAAPDDLPVVWKTNAYASADALELLKGCVDVVLADYKFGSDRCAHRLAGVPDYLEHTHRNLHWAARHSTLIVRHLLMPGHIECCTIPVLRWLRAELPTATLSLITGFAALWNSRRNPELLDPLQPEELKRAASLAQEYGLMQEQWTVAMPPPGYRSATEPLDDHVYIDRHGGIRIPYVTAELRQVLKQLESEFPTAVTSYESING